MIWCFKNFFIGTCSSFVEEFSQKFPTVCLGRAKVPNPQPGADGTSTPHRKKGACVFCSRVVTGQHKVLCFLV